MDKFEIMERLRKQCRNNEKVIGVAAGNGMTAKYAQQGGADFILALSAGRFRQMGVSSLAGFLSYANSNELVMTFATKELVPLIHDIPVCFGLCATDPTISLDSFIDDIQSKGFAGINNFPSVGLFDGQFGEALAEQGMSYALEVEAIRLASAKGLFTVAFVFTPQQAEAMIQAGADVICVHLGLTQGGDVGAKNILSLQSAKRLANQIFARCDELNSTVVKMIYGGPVNKPIDVQFMYDGTSTMGYIGGSVFERIPTEQMLLHIMKSFKETTNFHYDDLLANVMGGIDAHVDYIDFMKNYVRLNYMEEITLQEVAKILRLSRSYVSTLFKKEVGLSFSQYVIEFRLNRAIELMQVSGLPLNRIAEMVGYLNYPQFSKIFKKHKGLSPSELLEKKQKDNDS
ncbi:phosphoenolpyruvate hydrolase family protein [Sporosarcina sp. ITBMC105]